MTRTSPTFTPKALVMLSDLSVEQQASILALAYCLARRQDAERAYFTARQWKARRAQMAETPATTLRSKAAARKLSHGAQATAAS